MAAHVVTITVSETVYEQIRQAGEWPRLFPSSQPATTGFSTALSRETVGIAV